MFNRTYTNLSIAIENNIDTDNISLFAYNKNALIEDIYNQEGCYNNVNKTVERSVKWFKSCTFHDDQYVIDGWVCNLAPNDCICQDIFNVKQYKVDEISWSAADSKG